ncbi:MAG: antitoxin [Burkholderiaceae bacterium]
MTNAKVFWSGRSQAIRLPKEFRLESSEVRIRRHGESLILEPVSSDWAWLSDVIGPVDADFEAAATHRSEPQERPELDDVFK